MKRLFFLISICKDTAFLAYKCAIIDIKCRKIDIFMCNKPKSKAFERLYHNKIGIMISDISRLTNLKNNKVIFLRSVALSMVYFSIKYLYKEKFLASLTPRFKFPNPSKVNIRLAKLAKLAKQV